MIVTIDGPAGSGKSSTAKAVAKETGWYYLDSGSLYRTWTLLYIMGGFDKDVFLEFLDNHRITLDAGGGATEPLLNGERVGDEIRTSEVSDNVSAVAAMPEVRRKVDEEMKRAVKEHNFVADGRDLGSVVFPDAALKFYMIADLQERAKRRKRELDEKGIEADYNSIYNNLAERDRADSSREAAPLVKPDGAIEVDTTSMKFEEQVRFISEKIQKVLN